MNDQMRGIPEVGPQEQELLNSPIADESDEDLGTLRQEIPDEAQYCYFNDQIFQDGEYVRSDGALMRCERGLWVPLGALDPENP